MLYQPHSHSPTFIAPINSQSAPISTFCHLDCASFPHHLLSLIHNLINSKSNALEFPGSLVVRYPALSLLWLGSPLWHRFALWPGNFCMPQALKKKKKNQMHSHLLTLLHTPHIHSTLLLIHLPDITLCLSPICPSCTVIHLPPHPMCLPFSDTLAKTEKSAVSLRSQFGCTYQHHPKCQWLQEDGRGFLSWRQEVRG